MIENTAGKLVGVEVKASASVKEKDLRGLKKLANLAGDQFKTGVLLYDGTETMPIPLKDYIDLVEWVVFQRPAKTTYITCEKLERK